MPISDPRVDSPDIHQHLSILGHPFTIRHPPPILELDPYFFDEGYTLATQTSSSIWEGAHTFMSYLSTSPELQHIVRLNRCLELGTGTGVCGIAVGVLGGDVILTDIKSVLNTAQLNINDNFGTAISFGGFVKGRAIVEALDWTNDIEFKDTIYSTARIIIAVETCWLKELSRDFVKTFSRLLASTNSSCDISTESEMITVDGEIKHKFGIWIYKERGLEESECFTTLAGMTQLFDEFACIARAISRQPSAEDPGKHINILLVYLK